MRMMNRASRSESAFTIVEVLIAALIVTMVLAGGVYFVAGSGKAQQKTLVRQKMAAAADDISQRVRADQNWLKQTPSCKTNACDVSSLFPVTPAKSGDPKLDASVLIRPIDGEGDGLGDADDDHVRPDFYRIEIRITMSAAEQQKWGVQKPFETVSTVDAMALGRAVGSIVVQTIEVTNQVDERMSIAGAVGGGGNSTEMKKQATNANGSCTNPFPLTWYEWKNKRPPLPMGCNASFNSARNTNSEQLASVHTRGVTNVPFKLVRDNSAGGPATVRLHTNADEVDNGGNYVFSGLPAGTYFIQTPNPIPGGREIWKTKTVPSAGKTSVQGNQEARALITVRPVQGLGEYGVRFTRRVWIYELTTTTRSEYEDTTVGTTTLRTTTNYVYLESKDPTTDIYDGPVWTGLVGMEPKPFDRYRDGSDTVTQPVMLIPWKKGNAPNDGWWYFKDLPTGLHSIPAQQQGPSDPPDDYWGDFGNRSEQCSTAKTPGGQCGNFAWLNKGGQANGSVHYHDNQNGECYIFSNVSAYQMSFRLQLDGTHANRCSRTLVYVNQQTGKKTVMPNFLPDKNGNGGGRLTLSMTQTTTCIAGCELIVGPTTSTSASSSPEPSSTTSGSRTASTPPRPPANPPKLVIAPPPTSSGGSGGGNTMAPAVAMPSK